MSSHGIYTKEEINARAEIHIENYTTVLSIEARTMADMLRRQILPAVSGYAAELCERGWKKEQMGVSHKADDTVARELGQLTDKLFAATDKLERDLRRNPRGCQEGHGLTATPLWCRIWKRPARWQTGWKP